MFDPITLDQLRALVTVAEEGSFSAAARKLRRVQSAISTSMANLEDQLGVPVWDRSTKIAKLTEQDEKLKNDLEAFQDAAVTFDKQFQVGRWGRLFGHRPDDRRKTRENVRRLAVVGAEIEALMPQVRPGPEVHQAWVEVRRRWRRVGVIAAGM